MRSATLVSIALALAAAPAEATFPFHDSFYDCVPPNSQPWKCQQLNIFAPSSWKRDLDFEEEDFDLEKRTYDLVPKAAFAVSQVDKAENGQYRLTCNYEADQSSELNKYLFPHVKTLGIKNTGVADVNLIGNFKAQVSSCAKWSTTVLVKPSVQNGKCCLPHGFSIEFDFSASLNVDASYWSDVSTVFGNSCSYGFGAGNGLNKVDPTTVFNDVLHGFKKRDGNADKSPSKRTFGALGFLKGCATQKKDLLNFCWDCDCPGTSTSTTKSIPPASSTVKTSSTGSTVKTSSTVPTPPASSTVKTSSTGSTVKTSST
ncbi:uncharacterized protein CANTADRAFT_4671, partial [Suhomyces tanzawaensis NRRL Y-17324]